MGKESNIKLVKETFTEENTKQFLLELDLVLRTIDYYQVEKLIKRYRIHNDPECITFLDDIKSIFENWKIQNANSIIIGEVETRITKCYACFLGKNVTAYEFSYQHKDLIGKKSRLIYAREFAIFTDIKNKCLVDFGVCNGYLSKAEYKIVNP